MCRTWKPRLRCSQANESLSPSGQQVSGVRSELLREPGAGTSTESLPGRSRSSRASRSVPVRSASRRPRRKGSRGTDAAGDKGGVLLPRESVHVVRVEYRRAAPPYKECASDFAPIQAVPRPVRPVPETDAILRGLQGRSPLCLRVRSGCKG